MDKNIEFNKINKLKIYFPFDTNNSSKIYYEANRLHKIPYHMYDDTIKTLMYIEENKIKGVVKVTNFIENHNEIIGYTMKKYKNHKSLNKLKIEKFDNKIKDCLKIINMFQEYNYNNLIYSDFHTGNILLNTKNNDIKICDLDNFRISSDNDDKKSQLRGVLELCIEYIYQVDPADAHIVVNHSTIEIDKDNYFRECIKSVGDIKFHSTIKKIANLDRSSIPKYRRKIKEEAKQYINSGYYKVY